jgi:hypothetical protein
MKPWLLIFVWAFLFYSCKEVSFKTPQPVGVRALTEVPLSLQGKYQAIDIPANDSKDTIIIESWGYHMKDSNDKDWLGKGVISDSLILKAYQDYYFVSFRSGNQWVLRLIKPKSNGEIDFMSVDISDDLKRKEIITRLSKRMKVTEITHGDDVFYQINPTKAELMALIKDGFFKSITLKKVK